MIYGISTTALHLLFVQKQHSRRTLAVTFPSSDFLRAANLTFATNKMVIDRRNVAKTQRCKLAKKEQNIRAPKNKRLMRFRGNKSDFTRSKRNIRVQRMKITFVCLSN